MGQNRTFRIEAIAMSKIVVDESLSSQLSKFNTEIELCDESGRTLGHYFPQEAYVRLVYDWCNGQVSDDELTQESEKAGGRSLQEIWNRLGNK
jgi:hypothetical protein